MPAWAAHKYSVSWAVSQSTTIGSTQLKPGSYEIKAEEGQSQLQVLSQGKVVADVPCHWTQLPAKAAASEVEVDNNNVTSIEFGGKTAAIAFK
jgi:hypothetical protein